MNEFEDIVGVGVGTQDSGVGNQESTVGCRDSGRAIIQAHARRVALNSFIFFGPKLRYVTLFAWRKCPADNLWCSVRLTSVLANPGMNDLAT